MPTGHVLCDAHDAFLRVTLNRPPVNAFTLEMLAELHSTIGGVQDDPRPIVLVGNAGIFSAGYDIKQPVDRNAAMEQATRCLETIQGHRAPVVAAVEGAAIGLGLLIAASADILVAASSARMGMPEVTLGITSDVTPLRRLLPVSWIRRLCLLGETLTAEQLHLESAGAMLCEPGRAEQTAVSLLAPIADIDSDFLGQTKRHLSKQERLTGYAPAGAAPNTVL